MQSEQILINVGKTAATAYANATPAERKRISLIVSLAVRAPIDADADAEASQRLLRTVETIGKRAADRGATEEGAGEGPL